jgi:hypothetical protein
MHQFSFTGKGSIKVKYQYLFCDGCLLSNSIEFSVALEAKVVALKLSFIFFFGGGGGEEGVVVIRFGLGLSSFSHASRFDVDVQLPH